MKKLFRAKIVCVFFVMFLLEACLFPPIVKNKITDTNTALELASLLEKAPYKTSDYKINVFDCSNMTALLYDYLTTKGYKCVIVLGFHSLSNVLKRYEAVHTWLIVEKNKKRFLVETMDKNIGEPKNYNYKIKIAFYSLKELQELSWWFNFPDEWTYQNKDSKQ